jgi:hypothetical protein
MQSPNQSSRASRKSSSQASHTQFINYAPMAWFAIPNALESPRTEPYSYIDIAAPKTYVASSPRFVFCHTVGSSAPAAIGPPGAAAPTMAVPAAELILPSENST